MIDAALQSLFAPPGFESRAIPLRMIRKLGEPLLLLPRDGVRASAALGLYPAQTLRARLWRCGLELAVRVGWPLLEGALDFAPGGALGRFMASLGEVSLETFAVAFGNARAEGRRYLVLIFDRAGVPRFVVKVGASERGRELIMKEADVLGALPTSVPGVPALRGRFVDDAAAAFAVDFVPGTSPRRGDEVAIEPLLTSWIDRSRQVPLADLPAWHRLESEFPGDPALAQTLSVHPAIAHGDFTPWNVRVHDGKWTLVDWERGESMGVPGWDWLHYVVQQAVLVKRLDVPGVWQRVAGLLCSAPFARYAQKAGIAGSEELIARGYIRYCAAVLRPTERSDIFAELCSLTQP